MDKKEDVNKFSELKSLFLYKIKLQTLKEHLKELWGMGVGRD